MLKLMIVDDEKLIRKCLENEIPWKEHDIEVVAVAKNGIEALEYLREKMPDVVITDIKMPKMSGIDLIEKSMQNNYKAQFIILSGYGEFEYAKQAMNLGASYYLLKPIEPKELLEMVLKLKEKSNRNRIKIETFMKQMIYGTCTGIEYDDGLKTFSKEYDFFFSVILIQMEVMSQEDKMLYLCFLETMRMDNTRMEQVVIVDDNPQNIILTIYNAKERNLELLIDKTTHQIQDFFLKRDFAFFTISKGSISPTLEGVGKSYFEAMKYSNLKFMKGNSQILSAEVQYDIGYNQGSNKGQMEQNFIKNVLLYQQEKIEELTDEMFELFQKEKMSFHEIRIFLNNVISGLLCQDIFTEVKLKQIKNDMDYRISEVFTATGLKEMRNSFCTVIHVIGSFLDRRHINSSEQLVEKIKEYIENNYRNTALSLSLISQNLNFTPAYLSTLFSNLCGFSVTYYINRIRTNQAMEKLRYSDEKVGAIALDVGYENTTYFSTTFKKYIGVSPKEFRASALYDQKVHRGDQK